MNGTCAETVLVGDDVEPDAAVLVCNRTAHHDGLHWDGSDDISWIQGKPE